MFGIPAATSVGEVLTALSRSLRVGDEGRCDEGCQNGKRRQRTRTLQTCAYFLLTKESER